MSACRAGSLCVGAHRETQDTIVALIQVQTVGTMILAVQHATHLDAPAFACV